MKNTATISYTSMIQEMIHQYLYNTVDTTDEFTDGCQAQYKSRHCMGDVGYSCGDFRYRQVIRNYFETSHAKGHQDAAGGYIKRQIDLAILRGNVVINTAKDLYQYACDRLKVKSNLSTTARRVFRFVETSDINKSRNWYFNPIANNRDVHQIITSRVNIVQIVHLKNVRTRKCLRQRIIRLEQTRSVFEKDSVIETPYSVAESLCKLRHRERDNYKNLFLKDA
ncbi:LOW QUALITY PROTEIN: hypothetical protein MAR_004406 [Mya arenaria]|uniref:Uncharacterized protein n=1 Tax=Mya arenaria TaxID=6604 RepID=A0ABY7F073_MYAAR|nr:LOW QUALITY PROTEIN: hypothetical protein MAR_004406 [Mya arenaria]